MEIREYISIINKRKYLILLSVFFLLIIGVVVNYVILKPTYQGRAKVLVEPKSKLVVFMGGDRNAANMPPALDIDTYVKMLKSHRVGETAAKILHEKDKKQPSPDALQKQGIAMAETVEVNAEEDTGIINVSFNSENPEECTQVANAYVQAFVNISKDMTESSLNELESFVKKQLVTAQAQLEARAQKVKEFQDRILVENETTDPTIQETEIDQLIKQLERERMYGQIEQKSVEVRLHGFRQLLNDFNDVLSMGTASTPGWENITFSDQKYIEDTLRELELERIGFQEKYVEGHPKLREIDSKIELLENQKRRVINNYIQGRQITNDRYEFVRNNVADMEVELNLTTAKLGRIEESLEQARAKMTCPASKGRRWIWTGNWPWPSP